MIFSKFKVGGSSTMDKTWGFIILDSKEMGIEVLTFIDNFWTTVATWSLIIISDKGLGEIGFARETDGGVKKGVDNFSANRKGVGIFLGDESIIAFFLLSFLEILEPQ